MVRYIVFLMFIFSFIVKAQETLNVPFVKQNSEFCGPAALSSVFQYYGLNITQDEIGKEVYIENLKGALITDLENYARKSGFKTDLKKSNIEEIKKYIDEKKPVIALIDMGFLFLSKPHYIVIVGYNENGFFVNDGYQPNKYYSYKEFSKMWEKMGNIILVVYR